MNYRKNSPRITVKFIDSNTEKLLFELTDRTWLTVGEIFSDRITSELITSELKRINKSLPKNVTVIAVGEFELE